VASALQSQLEAAEARFRSIIANNVDGIVIVDGDGRVRFANPAAKQMLHLGGEELVGSVFGFPCVPSGTFEIDIIRDGGHVAVAEMRVVETDWEGSPAYLASLRDITTLKNAREALAESEERFRAIFVNAPLGMALMNADGELMVQNPALQRMLGYDEIELSALQIADITHPEDVDEELAWFREIWERRRLGYTVQKRLIRRDGRIIWGELTASAVVDENGDVSAVVKMVKDVTAQIQAASERDRLQAELLAAHRMEAVGQLAGGIAHDFNNLLTIVTGYAELMQLQFPEDTGCYQMSVKIHQAGLRAASLVQRLLAFSRTQFTQPRVIDLNALLNQMRTSLALSLGSSTQVVTRLSSGLWPVTVDPDQAEHIIFDLAMRAGEAIEMGAGSGTLVLETANVNLGDRQIAEQLEISPGDYVLLSVEDDGKGLTEQEKQHFFEPFYTTSDDVADGVGLRMASVYGAVKQNGGYIWVESRPAGGTAVRVYLPRSVEVPGAEG
jgi:two-component system, cell cycle sensor histidine kinase and response regulator CckA